MSGPQRSSDITNCSDGFYSLGDDVSAQMADPHCDVWALCSNVYVSLPSNSLRKSFVLRLFVWRQGLFWSPCTSVMALLETPNCALVPLLFFFAFRENLQCFSTNSYEDWPTSLHWLHLTNKDLQKAFSFEKVWLKYIFLHSGMVEGYMTFQRYPEAFRSTGVFQ